MTMPARQPPNNFLLAGMTLILPWSLHWQESPRDIGQGHREPKSSFGNVASSAEIGIRHAASSAKTGIRHEASSAKVGIQQRDIKCQNWHLARGIKC
jgi:hypothetical protein